MNKWKWFLGKNWKTSLCGVIAGAPQIAKIVWPDIPADQVNMISAAGLVLLGIFGKDGNQTGIGK